eukprot:scaffold10461_cov118-Isochrysis_galbana.AAC.1
MQEANHIVDAVLVDADRREVAVVPHLVHLLQREVVGLAIAVGLQEQPSFVAITRVSGLNHALEVVIGDVGDQDGSEHTVAPDVPVPVLGVGRVNRWYGTCEIRIRLREYRSLASPAWYSRASRLKRSPSKRSQSDGVPSNGETQKIRLSHAERDVAPTMQIASPESQIFSRMLMPAEEHVFARCFRPWETEQSRSDRAACEKILMG